MDSKEIKRLIRISPLRNSKMYHYLRFLMKKKRAIAVINQFEGEDVTDDRAKELVRQMKKAMVHYHWDFDEFFMYHFEDISDEKRKSFVPEYEKNIFCARVNDPEKSKIFDNKWATYQRFSRFFKRDVCHLEGSEQLTRQEFKEFIQKHNAFIVKPVFSASGDGIRFMTVSGIEDAKNKISAIFAKSREPLLLEELIVQSEKMGKYHKDSVNTLRMRTFRFDDKVELLPSNMRLGRGGAKIDNTSKGGISVALDMNGKAFAASDEQGNTFDYHPDSGVKIIGENVPLWEEAVSFVKDLAQIVPEVRYVGWDIALTNEGWVLIEGNDKGMFVGLQKPTQQGFRDKMNRILDELHIHL